MSTIREYFTLARARQLVEKLPEEERALVSRELLLARQRAEASEALWSNGYPAEALRLAREAFEGALEISPRLHASTTAPQLKSELKSEPKSEPEPEKKADAEKPDAEAKAGEESAEDADSDEEKSEKSDSDEDSSDPDSSDEDSSDPDSSDEDGESKADEADEAADEADEAADEADEADEAADEADEADEESASAEDSDPEKGISSDPEGLSDSSLGSAPSGGGSTQSSEVAGDSALPSWEIALATPGFLGEKGLGERPIRKIREAQEALSEVAVPTLDTELSRAHADLYEKVMGAYEVLDRAMSSFSLTPGQLRFTGIRRIVGWSLGLLLVLGAAGTFLLRAPAPEVSASDVYGANAFPAENAIDGNPGSEWLLNDRRAGWIEIRFPRSRSISKVKLLNSHNRHYNDRATRQYRVEIYSNGEIARTIEGEFPRLDPNPTWVEHEVDVDDVERIRVHVLSHHRLGGGFAEVAWE